MKPRQIELQIDELILNGFEIRDEQRVGLALQNELQRLFAERGVPASLQQGGTVPRLDGGAINVTATSGADAIGTQIAHSVYGGIK